MVYDLDNCPKIPLRNFTLKICLFGATNIVKASEKSKFVYSGYGIIFDAKGNWNFDNDFGRNVIIFDVDDSSLSHINNRKNNFLVLGEGNTCGTNESFGAPEKKFRNNFTKAKTKFYLSVHYNHDSSYLGKKSTSLKQIIKM